MSDPRISELLSGVSAIDLSRSVAGLFCGKILSDLGAAVTVVAADGGPTIVDLDPERAVLWLDYLNFDKQVAVIPGFDGRLDRELRERCRAADVLIETYPTGHPAIAALDDALPSLNPKLVRTMVTPFGRTGEYATWRSDEIVEFAMGGHMYIAGDRAREPLLVPSLQGELHAGLQAALGTVAALRHAGASGQGQDVEVTHLEALASAHNWLVSNWTHQGRVIHRDVKQTVRCKDGYMAFVPRAYNPDLFTMIGKPELIEDPKFSTFAAFVKNYREFWAMWETWASDYTKLEVWDLAQAYRLASCPVLEPREVLELEQTRLRGWLRESGGRTYPSGPIIMTEAAETLSKEQRARSKEGTSGPIMAAGVAETAPRRGAATEGDGQALPLAGIKVLELTSNWAGPLAARHLADLGATVVKIEFARKPFRAAVYAGGDPQHYHYNRSGYFNKMNRNKLGISLDVSHPKGKAAFLKLVDWADVVVENNSARVMPNLGLGFDTLSARNPGIIMASISGFGSYGEASRYVAFGVNIEGSSGVIANVGYSATELFGTGNNHGDSITAGYTATAIIGALQRRERTGRGAFLDMSIQEADGSFFAEIYMRVLRGGKQPPPQPAPSDGTTLRGVYRCMGDDSWLVVAIRAGDNLVELLELIGAPALPPHFDALAGPCRGGLEAALKAWAERGDHRETARALQRIGIAAGPVNKSWELLSDNHLAARSFYRLISHPEVGTLPFPGFPWRLSRTPGQIRMPAPLFAQHTREVLCEIAGLSEPEIAELDALDLISDKPLQPVARA